MGRIKKTLKNHVEHMVTCGLSKPYKQLESENQIIEDHQTNPFDISRSLSSTTFPKINTSMKNKSAFVDNRNSNNLVCYNCSECGHTGMIKVRTVFSNQSINLI